MATVTNTVSDFRSNPKKPVWRTVCGQMSWANAETTTFTSTVNICGIIQRIKAVYSAGTADPDLTLTITDLAGNTLTTTGAKDDNQTVLWKADGTDFKQNELAVFDGFIVSVVSQDPGASGVTADIEITGI